MAYYLEKNEPFSEGIRRIGAEQNDMAIEALAGDDDLHNGIHKARKHFKKQRALYRLVRDEVGHKLYKEGNVFYRDLGRKLAPLRDITSRIETVALLQEQFGNMVNAEAFDTLRALLEEERQAIRERELKEGDQVEETIRLLREESGRLLQLPVRDHCLKQTVDSLKRVYARGYKGFQKSLDDPTVEEMHEWRKRVKYLWYHYRLLRHAWLRVFRAYKKEIKLLADYLGDYHDLALLIDKMESYGDRLPAETHRILSAIARGHARKLLEDARELGALAYTESPAAFAGRMRGLLKDNLL
ncbi:MAG: CHAD domain-containing protein [Phaeodactylibacter sp.]|nr:CHAD domain-containing protein [Phaeodactylibacter sp.]